MSEFKYACPVCGQHMKCDSSQAGSVSECPTCFQKIVVPQAPATDDPKFILTGSKYTEKKIPSTLANAAASPADAPEKPFPMVVVVALAAVLALGAGIYFFGGKIFHPAPATGWQTGDIGQVGAPGSYRLAKGVFTVSGAGVDIWDQADSFHYVFQALNGDGTLTARVLNIKNTDAWAKAGVMIRESLKPESAYALALVTPASGIAFQKRDRAASPVSEVLHVPNQAAPCWVRLVRQGSSFTAFSSVNGTEWTPMGSATIPLPGQAYAGLVVCSHKSGTLSQAQFDNVALNAGIKAGPAAPPAAPKPVAPPANDTNWTLVLDEAVIPGAPVAGRIHGQDFIIERAIFQGGVLTLRTGVRGPYEFGVQINFSGAAPEALAGQAINVGADADKAAHVGLRWKEGDQVAKASFIKGYALRLEFGALGKDRLPGKIYLCAPDAEKSYLMGTFNAIVIKPKPKPPQAPK